MTSILELLDQIQDNKNTSSPTVDTEAKKTASSAVSLPHNLQIEQAILGTILMDNDVYETLSSTLHPEHFYDPLNGELYRAIQRIILKQRKATPLTIRPLIENYHVFGTDLTAAEYIHTVTQAAVGYAIAEDYAKTIYEYYVLRSLIKAGSEIIHNAQSGDSLTPVTEQITFAEQKLYQLANNGHYERGFIPFVSALSDAISYAGIAHKREGNLAGISTGLKDLDEKMGGLHGSDLIILAGRPSMGKTALATNIAFNVAADYQFEKSENGTVKVLSGGVVAFFSLEMSADQLASRILAEQTEISSEKLRRGQLNDEQFEQIVLASQQLENIPLYIDDTPAVSISTIASRCRRLKRQVGLHFVVIDYIQLVRPSQSSKRSENRVQEITEITQGLKALAKELNVPVLALSQLSRSVESRDDKRPQLSDLRESGSIEQDADVVCFVFREEYYIGRKEPREGTPEHEKWQMEIDQVRNLAEVIIGKQRHGPIGNVKLHFNSEFTRFADLAPNYR